MSYSLINQKALSDANEYLQAQAKKENLHTLYGMDTIETDSDSPAKLYRDYSSKPHMIAFRYQHRYHTIQTFDSLTSDPIIDPIPTHTVNLRSKCVKLHFSQFSRPKTYHIVPPVDSSSKESLTEKWLQEFRASEWNVLGYNEHRVALLETAKTRKVEIDAIQLPATFIRILHLDHNKAFLQGQHLNAIYGESNIHKKFASPEKVHWISNSQFVYVTDRGIICLFDLARSNFPVILDHFNNLPEMKRPRIKSLYENGYLITLSTTDTVCIWKVKEIAHLKDFSLIKSHATLQSNRLLTVISMRDKPVSDQSGISRPKIDRGVRIINQYVFKFPILVTRVHDLDAMNGRLVFTDILQGRILYQYYLPFTTEEGDGKISFDGRVVKLQPDPDTYIIIKPDFDKRDPLPIAS